MDRGRTGYLDLLRVVACIMVITIHVAARFWHDADINSSQWFILNFYDCLTRSSVPIFFMISGTLFLNKKDISLDKLIKKNISRVVICYIVWSIFYIYVDILAKQLWYLPVIAGIYIILPILHSFVHYDDGKYLKYYLSMFMVFGIVKGTLSVIPECPKAIDFIVNSVEVEMFGYVGYFLLGYCLTKDDVLVKLKGWTKVCNWGKWRYVFLFSIIVIITAILSKFISVACGEPLSNFYSNLAIFTFVETFCVFLFFKKVNIKYEVLNNIIEKVSNCTFGVYLVHIFVLECFVERSGLNCDNFNALVGVPALTIGVFTVSLIITSILRYIPVIRKWVI